MQETDPALLEAELRARVAQARGYDEAVWRLVLGEPDEGLAAIRRGLPDVRAAAPAGVHGARLALLAASPEEAARAAAAAVPEAIGRYVAGNREYHAAVLSLIAGDEEGARAHAADLDRFVASHDKLRGGEPSSVAQIPGGLIERDAGRVATGLEALLAWHLRRARARSDVFNSSLGVVSLDAVVALILAHRQGLAVPVAETYRAAQVPLLVVHLTEWQGRPLPRGLPISVVTDLVAGPWLRAHGVGIADPPDTVPRAGRARRAPKVPAASTAGDATVLREALRGRLRGAGHPWQLASWALMLGDIEEARRHLRAAAVDARRRWQDSAPRQGGALRWFQRDHALPNPNFVREAFAFDLVLGDEAGLRESTSQLQAWLRTQEGRGWGVYAHATGYLDLICDLIGGGDRSRPKRADVEQVSGLDRSTRVAAIGLFDRDAGLLAEGLDAILAGHAKVLERKTSPPPPISETAVHLAVAARRLGVPVSVDDRFRAWPVPVEGGRLPCDLLGRALWGGQA